MKCSLWLTACKRAGKRLRQRCAHHTSARTVLGHDCLGKETGKTHGKGFPTDTDIQPEVWHLHLCPPSPVQHSLAEAAGFAWSCEVLPWLGLFHKGLWPANTSCFSQVVQLCSLSSSSGTDAQELLYLLWVKNFFSPGT